MVRSSVGALCAVALFVFVSAACNASPPASQAAASVPPSPSATAVPASPSPSITPSPSPTPEPTPSMDPAVPAFAEFDPTRFSNPTRIDNPWLPLVPGRRWLIDGVTIEGEERIPHRITFTVTDLVKEIGGIKTVVVWIEDISDGELVEKEVAFYAQDDDGTVWYLGEHPEEYEGGEFVIAPTWIHGLEEARAGIKMFADPLTHTQTWYQGWGPAVEWSDYGRFDEALPEDCVTSGCYMDVVRFAESSVGEEGIYQLKSYAKDIGEIRVGWRGEADAKEELELKAIANLNATRLEPIRQAALDLERHAYQISPNVYGQTEPMQIAVRGG